MSLTDRDLYRFMGRRLLSSVPTVLAIILINFVILGVIPGDPARILAGEGAADEYVESLRRQMGLDRPVHVRLMIYLSTVLRGDLGYSVARSASVWDLVSQRLPATLLLLVAALTFSTVIGLVLGVWAARRSGSWLDVAASGIAALGYSVPTFWLAILLVLVFAVWLRWFPVQGLVSIDVKPGGFEYALDVLRHLTLPAVAMGAYFFASVAKITRTSMLEALGSDFIRTALAKGLRERTIVYKHGLRNAAIPIVTMVGYNSTIMFASAVLVETIFAWPGLGRLTFEGIITRDFALLMGILIVVSVFVVLVNLMTDVVYCFLDPRIHHR